MEDRLRDGSVKRRLRVLAMRFEGYSAVETAKKLGMNKSSIYAIYHRYETQGLDEFIRNKYAKNRRVLAVGQEESILNTLERRLDAGEMISTQDIIQTIQDETGVAVPQSYVYAMLKRNGWRKQMKPIKPADPGEDTAPVNRMCWMPGKR